MSHKPEILIIPGGGGLPQHYDGIVKPLSASGYSIRVIPLPSIGDVSEEPPTMLDDAALIHSETSKLVEAGKDVILIGHSYGGMPMTQSTKGLSKKDRSAEGKQGGVVRLGYMTCFLPPVGISDVQAMIDLPPKEHTLEVRYEDGWLYHSDVPASAAIVFSDLPQVEAEEWMGSLGRMSAEVFPGVLTHAGYLDIPVSYLFCEKDLCFIQTTQQAAIKNVERESGRKVHVTRIDAAHCPFASKPDEVVQWVLDVIAQV